MSVKESVTPIENPRLILITFNFDFLALYNIYFQIKITSQIDL